jgi:large subunit ribosomal protein L24
MKLKKGDKVKIIAGKDKGKVASILKVLKEVNKIVVEGVNIAKKHVKPGKISKEGGIIKIEKPIDASNAMYFDEKTNKSVRLGYKLVNGKKYRVSKKTGEIVDKKL